ncbi:MAG: S-layer homology domain-containing protein [Oscillospiraceae bacterium]|nr:S-layer homology domain-containing protein [Oscillospiraceae bacterium]
MKKRILSIAAALIMLLSCLPAAGAAGIYTDVGDPAVLEAALMLNRLGAIQPAEKLNPDETLTRAMFCAIAVMLSGRITDVEQYRYYTVFPDVRANHWALGYINAAVRELKLLGPRPDGTFGPDHAILFEEAVTIMVRMLGYGDEDLGYNWPRNYLNKAAALGLTAGVGQTRTLTRAQGILLFYNMLYISVNGESGDYI